MQITITGPRGGGCSTVAVEIAAHLERLGAKVSFVSGLGRSLWELDDRLAKQRTTLKGPRLDGCKVTIVDGVETEDEAGVRDREATRGAT